jgi:triosephosphate isomerase (TIM)
MAVPVRDAIIAGNWKMNYGPKRAAEFSYESISELGMLTNRYPYVLTLLCPPAISLMAVREVMDAHLFRRVELGAQNMYFEEQGAFTGETAPAMVRELCSSVILGHSERRALFGETDELVNKKVLAAFLHDLRPIVCVGENLEQYESNQTDTVIRTQVGQSLAGISADDAPKTVIAYEPVWAIGTGKAATTEIAGRVIHLIRELYGEMYGEKAAREVRILYGGSVTSANIGEFIAHPDIDGALVGGASLKPDFVEIVRQTIEAMQKQP